MIRCVGIPGKLLAVALCLPMALVAFDPAQQDDSLALLRHFDNASEPAVRPAFSNGSFEPIAGETITLMGGSGMEEQVESGYFEARLQRAYAERRLNVRSIAWPADTVYRQQRPMFFHTATGDTREGSVPDQRQRIVPGTFVLQFGKMESLDGESALPAFKAAYDRLLTELKRLSPRLVLIGPPPFFASGPAGELAEARNTVLDRYTAMVRELAAVHGAIFVDLAAEIDPQRAEWTRDGVHLSDAGQREAARILAVALGLGGAESAPAPDLLAAVNDKNFLWQQYFRPTNWAFLFGDRQHVPSSRGHRDTNRRWFIEELQRLPALISEAETEVRRVAAP